MGVKPSRLQARGASSGQPVLVITVRPDDDRVAGEVPGLGLGHGNQLVDHFAQGLRP